MLEIARGRALHLMMSKMSSLHTMSAQLMDSDKSISLLLRLAAYKVNSKSGGVARFSADTR
jgi:hypothetical protein